MAESFVAEYTDEPPKKEDDKKPEASLTEETSTEEEVNENPYEVKALEQGWRPKDEWEGEPSDWRDAKEFVERGELFDKIGDQGRHIKSQTKRIDELEKALKALGEHNRKIAKIEEDKAMKRLRAMKVEALEDGDHAKVLEVDDQIDELKEAGRKADEAAAAEEATPAKAVDVNGPQTYPQEVVEWLQDDRNKWYLDNVAARGAMNAYAEQYTKDNYGPNEAPDLDKVLKYAEGEVKKAMPHLFANSRKSEQSVSEPSGRATPTRSTKTKYSAKDLNDEQRGVMRTFIRDGVMSEEEYITQLVELGELG